MLRVFRFRSRATGAVVRLSLSLAAVLGVLAPNSRASFLTCVSGSATGLQTIGGVPTAGNASISYGSNVGGAPCGFPGGFSYSPQGSSTFTATPSAFAPGATTVGVTLNNSHANILASASLDAGILRISGSSIGAPFSTQAVYDAGFIDTLNWTVAPGSPAIAVHIHVDGSRFATAPFGNSDDTFTFSLGGSVFDYGFFTSPPVNGPSQVSGWGNPQFTNQTDHSFDFTGFIPSASLVGQRIQIEMTYSGAADNGFTSDFSHTAQVSFDLPPGVSFTSDSGVFLTAAPSAVPEPGTFVLAGLALIGIGASRKIRWSRK